MKHLKYIAIVLVAVIALVLLVKFKSCGHNSNTAQSITVPPDSNFAPVLQTTYQPPSIPFLSKKKMDVKLPEGISENKIKKVTRLTIQQDPERPAKQIDIIETEDGETFVAKDSSIKSIQVIHIVPPFFKLGFTFGAGLTLGKYNDELRCSPVALFAPITWDGWLHLPIVAADLDGVGLGAQAKVYNDISVGAVQLWRYDAGGQQSKIILSYNL